MYLKCSPTSKKKLSDIALKVRNHFNVNTTYFPIIEIIESLVDEGILSYEVVTEDDKRLLKDERAKFLFDDNCILIKESDYIDVNNDVGRARFTLTHEFSHYLLLKVFNFEVIETDEEPKVFEKPEWQANTLASYLLAPLELTKDFSLEELMDKCKLSEECALVILKLRK